MHTSHVVKVVSRFHCSFSFYHSRKNLPVPHIVIHPVISHTLYHFILPRVKRGEVCSMRDYAKDRGVSDKIRSRYSKHSILI